MTTSKEVLKNLKGYFRSAVGVTVLVSDEEPRIVSMARQAGQDCSYVPLEWDARRGLYDQAGRPVGPGASATDIPVLLDYIQSVRQRYIFILKDFMPWVSQDPFVRRGLRNLAIALPNVQNTNESRRIVLTQTSEEVHPDLRDHVVVVPVPLPDRTDMAAVFDTAVSSLPEADREPARQDRELAVLSAVGLTAERAKNVFARSLVENRKRILPAAVARDKKDFLKAMGLEWWDANPRGLDAVGGNQLLKNWCIDRIEDFSDEARSYGIPMPKGMFLAGVPGAGKSLLAKCIATTFGFPLVKFDIDSTQSKFVGESQNNLRRTLAMLKSFGPLVLWIDELEKAFAGSAPGAAADGGVAANALGQFLTFMQEKKEPIFVVATANDVRSLPPELLRKGRFDELFFLDLPRPSERIEILRVTLETLPASRYALEELDLRSVASKCVDYTGSEVAAVVDLANRLAWKAKRKISTEDLLLVTEDVVPTSKTSAEKINNVRQWAQGRARPASAPEVEEMYTVRSLDFEDDGSDSPRSSN
jgi:AAA+ superfamily predicted ATPase